MNWSAFDKFEVVDEKYLPSKGEGENMATQITTAVTKLVYKWFNDGDVYDNTYYMTGWCNDLSSYANWLYKNAAGAAEILEEIRNVMSEEEYEQLLYNLCELTQTFEYLAEYETKDKVGSVYDCDGPFEFREEQEDYEDEDDDYWGYSDEDDDEDEYEDY
jgi:hypothetical protein